MRARLLTAAVIAAAVAALGGMAVAVAGQVSTEPDPVPVVGRVPVVDDSPTTTIAATPTTPAPTVTPTSAPSDDGPNHD
ncbi:MAG: hypothetical protein KDA98_04285, partial [Acidimicrobiales bacterium]|nr:hypothetical protein [Acidimicrobiales bacterium]